MANSKTYKLFLNSAKSFPNCNAVFDSLGYLKYQDLLEEVEKLSSKMLVAGVRAQDLVSFSAPDGRFFLIGLLAIFNINAVVLPFAQNVPDSSRLKVENLLEANVSLNFVDNQFIIQKKSIKQADFSGIMNPIAIRPSSGTTGAAKGVLLDDCSIDARTSFAEAVYHLTPGEAVGFFLPMSYHFIVSIMTFLRQAACLVTVPGNIFGSDLYQFLLKHQTSIIYGSPMSYKPLINKNLDFIRLAISTTTALDHDLALAMFKNKRPLNQALGIIEMGMPFVNLNPNQTNLLSVGQIMPGYQAKIADDQELLIKSEAHFAAYTQPKALFYDLYPDGWFPTGDLAKIDDQGNCFILARKKTVINVLGHKVFPEEVENIILQIPNVIEVLVEAEKDSVFGELVSAKIVTKQDLTETEVRKFCRKYLEPYKIPQIVNFVENLAKTTTGKIKRC